MTTRKRNSDIIEIKRERAKLWAVAETRRMLFDTTFDDITDSGSTGKAGRSSDTPLSTNGAAG